MTTTVYFSNTSHLEPKPIPMRVAIRNAEGSFKSEDGRFFTIVAELVSVSEDGTLIFRKVPGSDELSDYADYFNTDSKVVFCF